MAKRQRSKKSKPRRLPRGPILRGGAYLVLAVLLAGAGYVGATSAWAAIVASPRFHLNLRAFSLEDGPIWVKAPAMSRELRRQLTALPAGASIFDHDLAADVQQQLSRCPYLLQVQAVQRRLPNTLAIQASFRKPAGIALWNGTGYMVDQDGYRLPDTLFSPPPEWKATPVPVIKDRLLTQPPPVGRAWDWPCLAVGARFCEFLQSSGLLERLPISTIDVTGVGRQSDDSPDLPAIVLTTTGGAQVKWGASSVYADLGLEEPAFLIPDGEKLHTLLSKLADYPNLRGIQYLDLRFHGKVYFRESN